MKIEIRSAKEAIIEGYVNAVERDSRLLPPEMCRSAEKPFYERVRSGTFKKALSNGNVELRFNHGKTLGKTGENLTLHEDNIGLYAKAAVNDPDVIAKAKAGELRGWSFGFICQKDQWETEAEYQRRNLDEIRLLEVSILDKTPAYIGTSIEMRDKDCTITETRCYDEVVQVDNREEIPHTTEPAKPDNRAKQLEILRLKIVKK